MNFLNTFYLAGLLLILIPVILHLLRRRTEIVKKFPAVRFIIRARMRMRQRFILKDLLLLVVRVFAFIFLTISMSMPFTGTPGAGLVERSENVLILLDNSMSMCYEDNGSLLERGKKITESILGSLGFMVTVGTFNEGLESYWKVDRKGFVSVSDDIRCSYYSTDIFRALSDAIALMEGGKKRVYIITDLTLYGWDAERISGLIENEDLELIIADVSEGLKHENYYISGIRTKFSGDTSTLVADISSSGASLKTSRGISLTIGREKTSYTTVKINGNGSGSVSFSLSESMEETPAGFVEIEDDHLKQDNRRFFIIENEKRARILILDDSPDPRPLRSESYFIRKVIEAARTGGYYFDAITVRRSGLDNEKLSRADALMILNVNSLTDEIIKDIISRLREGMGLFISAGERLDLSWFNRTLSHELGLRVQSVQDGRFLFGESVLTSQLFDFIKPGDREILSSTVSSRRLLITPIDERALIHLKFTDGVPALVESGSGKGRVFVLATTVDRDWSNLPLQPVFLPMILEILRYLVGGNRPEIITGINTGKHTIRLPEKTTSVLLKGPGSETKKMMHAVREAEIVLSTPGIWELEAGPGKSRVLFVVNTDPRESELARWGKKELKNILRDRMDFLGREFKVQARTGFKPLWPVFIFIFCLLMAGEAFLSSKKK